MQKPALDSVAWVGSKTLYAELTSALIDSMHFQFVANIHSEDPATGQITTFEGGRMTSEIEYAEDDAVDFVLTIKRLLADLGVEEEACIHTGRFSESVAAAADKAYSAVEHRFLVAAE